MTTDATRKGARPAATPAKARAKTAKPAKKAAKAPAKPAKTAPELPESPIQVNAPQGLFKPFTPGRRWLAWLATVGEQAAASHLTESIAAGDSLPNYCAMNFIPYTTVRDWINADDDRAAKYAQAREDRADKLADEIVGIADELDIVAKHEGEDVRLALDPTAVARNRLRVDARKWVAAKLKPRVYGDKTTTELTGADGGAIQHSLAVRFVASEGGSQNAGSNSADSALREG